MTEFETEPMRPLCMADLHRAYYAICRYERWDWYPPYPDHAHRLKAQRIREAQADEYLPLYLWDHTV